MHLKNTSFSAQSMIFGTLQKHKKLSEVSYLTNTSFLLQFLFVGFFFFLLKNKSKSKTKLCYTQKSLLLHLN